MFLSSLNTTIDYGNDILMLIYAQNNIIERIHMNMNKVIHYALDKKLFANLQPIVVVLSKLDPL